MATLNNFHTGNAGAQQEALHPHRRQRLMGIQKDLHRPSAWDLPNLVPIGPIQSSHPPMISGSNVDPQVTERRGAGSTRHFVPTTPYTRVMQGDTADGRLLYKPPEASNLWTFLKTIRSPNKTPVQTRLHTDVY